MSDRLEIIREMLIKFNASELEEVLEHIELLKAIQTAVYLSAQSGPESQPGTDHPSL